MDRQRQLVQLSRALERSILLLDVPRERMNATDGVPFDEDMREARGLATSLGFPCPPYRIYESEGEEYGQLAYPCGTIVYCWKLSDWTGAGKSERAISYYCEWRIHTLVPLLQRWKVVVDQMANDILPDPLKGGPEGTTNDVCRHSEDFATCIWHGRHFTFNRTQARMVEKLWTEWRNGGLGLSETYLGEVVETGDNDFRLDKQFRGLGAMGHMIHAAGKRVYKLGPPANGIPKKSPDLSPDLAQAGLAE